MDIVIYGVDFKHRAGEFCVRTLSRFFFIGCFRTDFVTETNGRLVRGRAGDMLIVPPNTPIYHGPCENTEEGFRNDWIYVGGDDLEALLKKYPLPMSVPFHTSQRMTLANSIERIHKERAFDLAGAKEKCDMIIADMVIDLFREYSKNDAQSSSDKLEYTRGIIMRDYKLSWTLPALAKLSGYSPSRFSALYKEKYGISPVSDLISFRLENAKRLLIYSNMTVLEISESVGFSSIYYFSKHFKKLTGVSPTEYKRNHSAQLIKE